jgi:hypothetical protein
MAGRASKMYPVILEEVSQILRISTRELESDIKEIAEYWEVCLEKAAVSNRDVAIFILTTCANCYLRGRGIRLENHQLLKKNNGVLISLVTLVPLYTWGQPANHFPKIHELIPIEVHSGKTAISSFDILDLAEKILREKSEY